MNYLDRNKEKRERANRLRTEVQELRDQLTAKEKELKLVVGEDNVVISNEGLCYARPMTGKK